MKDFNLARKQDPDGLCVHILRGDVRGFGELMQLTERLPNLCPEGAFLAKMRVTGRPNGRRMSVVIVFEFYERAEVTRGSGVDCSHGLEGG